LDGDSKGLGGRLMSIFDSYSMEYDEWYDKNRLAYLSEIEALKQVVPRGGKGLEIGVGTGRFAVPLGVSFGVDPSEKMLEIAKERGVKAFLGKGEQLPFGEAEFDFVLMVVTLCFVDNPDLVLSESRRVLRDGGKIIIGIVDKNSYLGRLYQQKKQQGHKFYEKANFYSVDEVIGLLKRHNFDEIVTYQTIFQPLEELKEVEKPEKGYGKGSFVVICGRKG
jgi:ubiquinone/menaquinone biosynthesis C-methylase UbiE